MSTPGPDERRGYARGYSRGRRAGDERAEAATWLLECLISGLVLQGVSLDAVLDTQLAGAKARLFPEAQS